MKPAPRRAVMLWSGGKDSTMALEAALADDALIVEGLVTTVTSGYDRISIHGVRRSVLEAQAGALSIPLHVAEIASRCTNEMYETSLGAVLAPLRQDGVTVVIAGDLFLADVRAYRTRTLSTLGFDTVFPIWGIDTDVLAERFIASGAVATLCCVDPSRVPASLAGRQFDRDLLASLPAGVDPCGENGEFHTFVSDASCFSRAMLISVGDIVERDGFVFADLTS